MKFENYEYLMRKNTLLCAITKCMAKFYVCRGKTHGKVLCLSCVLCRRTAKFQKKNEFLASFYFSTTNTLFCNIYFTLVHISIFLLFLTNLFR
jgi:hypothetical protein